MVASLDVSRARMAWLFGGIILALAVLFVVHSFVGTFVFGIFIYYATRPVYDRMTKRVGDRRIAAVVSLLTLALPVLILFAYSLAIGLQELTSFLETYESADLGGLQAFLGPYLNVSTTVSDPSELLQNPGDLLNTPGLTSFVQSLINEGLGVASSVGGFVGNALLHLFIMIALAYYLLVDGAKFSDWLQKLFADDRGVMDQFAKQVDKDFENVFFGNILNALLTGAIGALTYSVLDAYVAPIAGPDVGIPYAALVGLLAGAGSLVPVVGMKIVYVPVALYLVVMSTLQWGSETLWFALVFVALSFVVVDVVPDLGLRPYVSGRNLHTGTVMLAYIFGPLLWGWYGLFLGPILLVLVVNFARIALPELVEERQLTPYSVDPTYIGTLGSERADPQGSVDAVTDGSAPDEWIAPDPDGGDGDANPAVDDDSARDGTSDETGDRD